jgi:hypothetical protein
MSTLPFLPFLARQSHSLPPHALRLSYLIIGDLSGPIRSRAEQHLQNERGDATAQRQRASGRGFDEAMESV